MTDLPQILIVDHASIIGGAELSLEALVTYMPPDRYQYTVVLPVPGPLVERLRQRGVSVRMVPLESWRWWVQTRTGAVKFALSFPLQVVSLMRWLHFLRREKPDIIHFNINRVIEPVIAAWLLRIPSVMHFRDIPSRIAARPVLGWSVFYWIMNLASYWIANSQATYADIAPHNLHAVACIPNGLDLAAFDRAAAQANGEAAIDAAQGHIVAMVALLVEWKNHPTFIQVAAAVLGRRSDVTFVMAGAGDVQYEAELRRAIAALNLNDRIRLLGMVENIPALLQRTTLLVHTTLQEPFGRVFIEAMAASRPVVAFSSGGAAEIVVNGETGILVPGGDINAMADVVCQLLDNPDLRRQMGEAGRQRVETSYTLQRHVGMVLDLYDRILVHEKEKNPK